MTTAPPAGPAATDATEDVRVARVHLRLGQLALARAELEDLAAGDELGTDGLAVLAEARWRTGDRIGAADAAEEHLRAGGSAAIAICIAAEAAAAEGRPDDARELMDRLPGASAATLDRLFAGMPRRASWPAGPVDHTQLDEIRREVERRGGVRGTQAPRAMSTETAARGQPGPADPARTGPWASADAQARLAEAQAAAAADVELARRDLEAHPNRAILRLGLALRRDPSLAAEILDVVAMRREPAAAMLRGDASRLLGHHDDADAAFDAAARTLEEP